MSPRKQDKTNKSELNKKTIEKQEKAELKKHIDNFREFYKKHNNTPAAKDIYDKLSTLNSQGEIRTKSSAIAGRGNIQGILYTVAQSVYREYCENNISDFKGKDRYREDILKLCSPKDKPTMLKMLTTVDKELRPKVSEYLQKESNAATNPLSNSSVRQEQHQTPVTPLPSKASSRKIEPPPLPPKTERSPLPPKELTPARKYRGAASQSESPPSKPSRPSQQVVIQAFEKLRSKRNPTTEAPVGHRRHATQKIAQGKGQPPPPRPTEDPKPPHTPRQS